jgi:thiol-disulfide isomerase/thioredoxin
MARAQRGPSPIDFIVALYRKMIGEAIEGTCMNLRSAAATIVVGTLLAAGVPTLSRAQGASRAFVCPPNAKTAPLNYTLKGLDNAPVRLADFKGKVLLLDFWATWCGPCKVEIPWFMELQKKYASRGFSVVGISTDDTLALLKPYVTTMKMNYPVLQGKDRDDVMDAFGPIVGMPTTVMISRTGKICATHAGLTSREIFESEVQALLAPTR